MSNLFTKIDNTVVSDSTVNQVLDSLTGNVQGRTLKPFDLSATANTQDKNLTDEMLLKAADGVGLYLADITDGAGDQDLLLNIKSGVGATGDVARRLQTLFNLTTVDDVAVLKFSQPGNVYILGGGAINLTSDDSKVAGAPVELFGAATIGNGVSLVSVRATNVTSGSEAVALLQAYNTVLQANATGFM